MSVPQVVVASYLATACVGAIGLIVMSANEQVAIGLCLGTAAVLLAATVILKQVDVQRPAHILAKPEEDRSAA
jgi:UDP-GlcNAc:undecaprenyl-phosphate GlcNAc-1-phosphate transferase